MSSDVSHPASVGFHWIAAVGMSQRPWGGVGVAGGIMQGHPLSLSTHSVAESLPQNCGGQRYNFSSLL